jgi:hypothetical protein
MDLREIVRAAIAEKRLSEQELFAELDKEHKALKRKRSKANREFINTRDLAGKVAAQRKVRAIDAEITAWRKNYFDRQDELLAAQK